MEFPRVDFGHKDLHAEIFIELNVFFVAAGLVNHVFLNEKQPRVVYEPSVEPEVESLCIPVVELNFHVSHHQ
jgi:hypothetical protein